MSFNSKTLQKCFESVKPILDNVNKAKDTVSEDINFFEKYLSSIKLNESAQYIVSDPEQCFEPLIYNEFTLVSNCCCHEELLIWDHNKKRLIFAQYEYSGVIYHEASDIPSIDQNSRKTVIHKPLIETSFEIRKNVYEHNHLTEFLKKIAKKYDIHGLLN